MPELEKFYRDHHEQAELLAISMDSSQDILNIKQQKKLSFPLLYDDKGQVFAQYGVRSVPMTFVINARGQIIKQLPGPVSSKELVKYIK